MPKSLEKDPQRQKNAALFLIKLLTYFKNCETDGLTTMSAHTVINSFEEYKKQNPELAPLYLEDVDAIANQIDEANMRLFEENPQQFLEIAITNSIIEEIQILENTYDIGKLTLLITLLDRVKEIIFDAKRGKSTN